MNKIVYIQKGRTFKVTPKGRVPRVMYYAYKQTGKDHQVELIIDGQSYFYDTVVLIEPKQFRSYTHLKVGAQI